MPDNTCYILYNSTTIYAFPNLRNCVDGHNLPSFQQETRDTYNLYNGRWVKTHSDLVNNNYNNYTNYVAYIANDFGRYSGIDPNYLILPATLLVLAFFLVIYKWFIRLRG